MNFWLEVINSRQKLGENLVTWYKYTFAVCRKRGSKSSNPLSVTNVSE